MADITRTTPTGTQLENGFGITIAIEGIPGVAFWEVEVTPGTFDGGQPVPASNMWNVDYETKSPGALIDVGDYIATGHYDPKILDDIRAAINVEKWITVKFPDGSKETFGGFLRNWARAALQKNNKPTCTIAITCSNRNPTSKAEVAPDYVAPV